MHEKMRLDERGKKKIVGVEKDDIFSGARREARSERGRLPKILFVQYYVYIRLVTTNAFEHGFAIVGRGVIDDDAFDMRIGLGEDGIDRFEQEATIIIIGDNYAYQRQEICELAARRARFGTRA
jgi:hypothetical protein